MTDQPIDPRRDPDWITVATDDAEDAQFYDNLNREYEFYSGPLTFSQYCERADAARTNVEMGWENPLPYDDIVNAYDEACDDAYDA